VVGGVGDKGRRGRREAVQVSAALGRQIGRQRPRLDRAAIPLPQPRPSTVSSASHGFSSARCQRRSNRPTRPAAKACGEGACYRRTMTLQTDLDETSGKVVSESSPSERDRERDGLQVDGKAVVDADETQRLDRMNALAQREKAHAHALARPRRERADSDRVLQRDQGRRGGGIFSQPCPKRWNGVRKGHQQHKPARTSGSPESHLLHRVRTLPPSLLPRRGQRPSSRADDADGAFLVCRGRIDGWRTSR